MQFQGRPRVTAGLGDEPAFRADQCHSRVPPDLAVPPEPAVQVLLGPLQQSLPARRERETDLRELLAEPVRLLDGEPTGPCVELVRTRIVT